MIVQQAYFSHKCPGQLIIHMPNGKKYWCRMVPARKLQERDLSPLSKYYYCTKDDALLPMMAKSLYGLDYAETTQ